MDQLSFYRCPHCGNVIVKTVDSGVPVVCCGGPMQRLVPHTEDMGQEKHLPVVGRSCRIASQNCSLTIRVGSEPHPMTPEHHIEWICLEHQDGFQLRRLSASDPPYAEFCYGKERATAVYEYCNLHGLWKTVIQ